MSEKNSINLKHVLRLTIGLHRIVM